MLKVTRNGDLYFRIGKNVFYIEIASSSTNNTFILFLGLFSLRFHADIGKIFYFFGFY